jgi:hypothetical protein
VALYDDLSKKFLAMKNISESHIEGFKVSAGSGGTMYSVKKLMFDFHHFCKNNQPPEDEAVDTSPKYIGAPKDDMFIVINRKHLKNIPEPVLHDVNEPMQVLLEHLPPNKYYVCNTDEPYAKDVLNIILEGEGAKIKTPSNS